MLGIVRIVYEKCKVIYIVRIISVYIVICRYNYFGEVFSKL